jgi:DNA-binding CsgD family transcriptional regulator
MPGEEPRDAARDMPCLSERQLQILALVAEGATDNEIAARLYLSVKTVSWHMRRICARLQARSRTHAVALALRRGILPSRESPGQGS